ncbi:MAG: adenylyl-sulfate kinase [Nitrospina sp.]|nr:adenylyl-sulfate kinase [Nitrospina sp.]
MIVSIISPIDKVRKQIRKMLSPGFYLIYVTTNIETLKDRDPKGLYKKAAEKEITNLIGYSAGNPYDIPLDADLINDTSKGVELEECKKIN